MGHSRQGDGFVFRIDQKLPVWEKGPLRTFPNAVFAVEARAWRRGGDPFRWLEGPDGVDMERGCQAALTRGVGAVPGRYCFTGPGRGRNTMRLNFTDADPDELRQAVGMLCGVLLPHAAGIGAQAARAGVPA